MLTIRNTRIIRFIAGGIACLFLYCMPVDGMAQRASSAYTDSVFNAAAYKNSCGIDDLLKQLRADPAYAAAEKKMNDAIYQKITSNRIGLNGNIPATPVTLPVVVHIVNDNPDAVLLATIEAGIQNLNDAFSKTGPYAASKGVDTKFRFVLAKRDPNGGLTNGVTRVKSHYGVNFNMYTEDFRMKNLMNWDPAKYINIWMVDNIVGEIGANFSCGIWSRTNAGGYASLPVSQPFTYGIPDGIVTTSFGVILAHEMGHYLGLYHTFDGGCNNNNCLTDGDRVCDTPPDASSTSVANCNDTQNSCGTDTLSAYSNGFFPKDTTDLIANFMDYNNQSCQNMFTEGQADRMHAALQTQRSGLINNAITAPCNSTLRASFTRDVIDPKPTDNITFTSNSTGVPITYAWTVNGVAAGAGPTLSRTFPDATFPYFKKHVVTLKVTDVNGCISNATDYVLTNCGLTARFSNNKKFIASLTGVMTDTILFTNNSMSTIGAPTYEWILYNHDNGFSRSIISTNTAGAFDPKDLNYEFPSFGNYSIRLKATLGACADSSESLFLNIANPREDAYMAVIGANCFQNTKARVSFYVCNFGYKAITPGLPVSFYNRDPANAGARKIGDNFIIPDSIKGICCGRVYIDTVDVGYEKLDTIYLVANNTTTAIPLVFPDPGATIIEKDYNNNKAVYTGFRYKATIIPATANMAPGDTIQLRGQGSPDGATNYTWGPTGNFSCATCNTTFFSTNATADTTKQVILKSLYQCTDTAYINIKVPPYNDYTVSIGAVSCSPNEDSLYVDFTVNNLFKRGIIPKNLEVSFYKNDPRGTGAVLLAAPFKTPDSVLAKLKTYRYKVKKARGSKIYVSVNDHGAAIPVVPTNAPFAESIYTNNFDSASYQPIAGVVVDTTICSGLNFAGHTVTGVYRDTILSKGGCDSVNIINLTVKNPAPVQPTVSATICEGQSYTLPSGRTVTTNGTHRDTLRTRQGCDSLVNVVALDVRPVIITTLQVSICQGQSYQLPWGPVVTTTATYRDTIRGYTGCDSIRRIVVLEVQVPVRTAPSVTICNGQVYMLPSGRVVGQAGIYRDTIRYTTGCDSLLSTVTLSITPPAIRRTAAAAICEGSSFRLPSGKITTTPGTNLDTIKYVIGCDSLITTVNLVVETVRRATINAGVCSPNHYTMPSGKRITVEAVYQDTLRTRLGCDSIIYTVNLDVTVAQQVVVTKSICTGETYTMPTGRVLTVTGVYRDTLRSVSGCDSLETLVNLTVNRLPVIRLSKSNDVNCMVPATHLTATGGIWYTWEPAASLNNASIENPVASPSVTTMFTVRVMNFERCVSTDSILVNVSTEGGDGLPMPSAFTPNGDGVNDCFGVRNWGKISELDFVIYGRTGQKIFQTSDPSKCWDGTHLGQKLPSGTYIFQVSAGNTICGKVFKKGTVVLIR